MIVMIIVIFAASLLLQLLSLLPQSVLSWPSILHLLVLWLSLLQLLLLLSLLLLLLPLTLVVVFDATLLSMVHGGKALDE